MSLKYLLDENLDPIYKRQLIENNPNLVVWKIGEPNVPLAPKLSIGENINQLIFIAEASFDDEYQDQIVYLPKI